MTTSPDLARQVWRWIEEDKKEDDRLEFKLKIELRTAGAKAEFIRDVLALANSGGECPRSEAYLVIGFRMGRLQDIRGENYDGARFGQLLDAYIYPHLDIAYEEFEDRRHRRVGVIIVKPDADVVYVVNKKLADERGQRELSMGQSWERVSDRKNELDGEAIGKRWQAILERKIAAASAPLRTRIEKLERDAGPALEVKRIRFAMEASRDWSSTATELDKLIPYAREFDHAVKNEVIDAVMEATSRTRDDMPESVAHAVDQVLSQLIPAGIGGMRYSANRPITEHDVELLQRIEHALFELTWDACRYLRDVAIVEIASRR
jgi:hypothetical protein